jgi:NlpC/P60 family
MPASHTSSSFLTGRRFPFLRTGFCAVSLCASASAASAQRPAAPAEAAPAVRLVSAEQGRKIAAVALERDEPLRGAQDCSHLVQQIYSFAGYEYPYASSFDLYAGNSNFRRVKHAQAGDLIVWPGHVGIVLDPKRHRFYSLVRSGLQAEDYVGLYWRSRGRPRFYRYVVSTSDTETAKAVLPPPRHSESSLHRSGTVTAEVRVNEAGANAKPATQEASMREKVASTKAPGSDAVAEALPSSILIASEQRRPTVAEANDKILELSAAASVLRTAEPLQVATPVVIVDELRVEKIETKRDKGFVHLQIDSHVRIGDDGVDFKRRREKVRWELRRDDSGWTAIAPTDRLYVTRDVAVRELAAQLAEMTRSEAAANHEESVLGQEARIANLLSALLEK